MDSRNRRITVGWNVKTSAKIAAKTQIANRGSMQGKSAYHLQSGYVFLPAQILLVFRSHGRHHVIRVHDDVDEGVNGAYKNFVSAWVVFGATPTHNWHYSVMVHVEKSDLVVLFAQDKKDGVQQLRHFCQKVYVNTSCYLKVNALVYWKVEGFKGGLPAKRDLNRNNLQARISSCISTTKLV